MNEWQLLKQIKYLLVQQNWTGSSNPIFGTDSVQVTSLIKNQARSSLRVPLAMIYPAEANSDPLHGQEPDLVQQNIGITLATVIPGSAVGEAPLLGKNVPDNTKSEGRGLLELEEEIFNAIGRLGTGLGVVIQHTASGKTRPDNDESVNYIVYRDHLFAAWITKDRFYHPAINLTAVDAVAAGDADLAWIVPPDRYDRFRVILRRAVGATAPTSITDGTGVILSGNLAASVTDSPGAGTFSYALFGTYDELDGRPDGTPDTDQRVSASITRLSLVVN